MQEGEPLFLAKFAIKYSKSAYCSDSELPFGAGRELSSSRMSSPSLRVRPTGPI